MERQARLKNCIVCSTEIPRGNVHTTKISVRGIRAVTCSSKCSRVYDKISKYFRGHYYRKIMSLEKELKRLKIKLKEMEKENGR